jgi:hypothetical protein
MVMVPHAQVVVLVTGHCLELQNWKTVIFALLATMEKQLLMKQKQLYLAALISAPVLQPLLRKVHPQLSQQQLMFVLALSTRMEPPAWTPAGSGALPAPMQVVRLQHQNLAISANVGRARIVVLWHASSALKVLPPQVADLYLFLTAMCVRLTTGGLAVLAQFVRRILLPFQGPHNRLAANV